MEVGTDIDIGTEGVEQPTLMGLCLSLKGEVLKTDSVYELGDAVCIGILAVMAKAGLKKGLLNDDQVSAGINQLMALVCAVLIIQRTYGVLVADFKQNLQASSLSKLDALDLLFHGEVYDVFGNLDSREAHLCQSLEGLFDLTLDVCILKNDSAGEDIDIVFAIQLDLAHGQVVGIARSIADGNVANLDIVYSVDSTISTAAL